MDAQASQMAIALAGFIATLLGVCITQIFNSRNENRRRAHESATRWHDENYRVSSEMATKAMAAYRNLYHTATFLDDNERDPRIPGYLSIQPTPSEGVPGIIDEIGREILVEGIEKAYEHLEELDALAGELAIIGSPSQISVSEKLRDQLLDAIGAVERFEKSSHAYEEIIAVSTLQEQFSDSSRHALSGSALASRRRNRDKA